jgi:hypothetical protein
MPEATLPTLLRAFEIAKSGAVDSVLDLRKKLKREGFSVDALEGGALRRQLALLIKEARKTHPTTKAVHRA